MKLKLIIFSVVFVFSLSSCQKDLATDWTGTYVGVSGSTFSRVVVTKVNDKTIKLELQSSVLGSYVTQATIANGKLNSVSSLSVNEDGNVLGYSGVWHFSGAGNRDGNQLILNGTATQTGQSNLDYTFTGNK